MKRLMATVLAAAAIGAHAPARAQSAAPADAERARLAAEVFQAIGGEAALRASMQTAVAAATAQLPKVGSAEHQALAGDMQAYVSQRLAFYTPEILRASEGVYAREFTAAQLRDILAFYRSPTGQALAHKLPEIAAQSVVALRPVMLRLQRDTLAHACQLTKCSADQQKMLAALQQAAG